MKILTIEVPGDPVPKGRHRMTYAGGKPRSYTPKRTIEYESRVVYAAIAAMRAKGWKPPNTGVPVSAVFEFKLHRPKGRTGAPTSRPDADNFVKCALDGLVLSGALLDDSQVTRITAEKSYADDGMPKTCIMLMALEDEGVWGTLRKFRPKRVKEG